MMNLRQDTTTEDWPLRPWIMAAICATAGLLFHFLTDHIYGAEVDRWRQAGAAFVAVAAVSFVLTVEQRRWLWSLYFALGWGTVIALVGWFTASYNQQGEIAEFPFLSGVFAVLLAAPLFQTMRDTFSEGGAGRFPYPRLHGHAWTDAVIGAASLVFVGIAWLLAWLIAMLFDLIGIEFFENLLKKEWFGWMLAGFAFGSAVGLLRERDALVGTLQRLVMVVLSVLAPVLAVALVAFLASVPFTGLDELWESVIPATPLMLVAAAGAILLANAVFGDGEEDKPVNRALRYAAPALVLTVLPLAIIAVVSLAQRIGQYGWTPERIWGVVAVAVALVYGLAGWWSVGKGRAGFDAVLRPLQVRMALGLCALALFLALPILDFGSISARSQLARLESGSVKADEFDWAAMAFDFGPSGRARLEQLARSGAADQRTMAGTALKSKERHRVGNETREVAEQQRLSKNLRILSPDIVLTSKVYAALTDWDGCNDRPCALLRLDDLRLVLITSDKNKNYGIGAQIIDLPRSKDSAPQPASQISRSASKTVSVATGRIEVRPVERRQVFVDGTPVGEPFE